MSNAEDIRKTLNNFNMILEDYADTIKTSNNITDFSITKDGKIDVKTFNKTLANSTETIINDLAYILKNIMPMYDELHSKINGLPSANDITKDLLNVIKIIKNIKSINEDTTAEKVFHAFENTRAKIKVFADTLKERGKLIKNESAKNALRLFYSALVKAHNTLNSTLDPIENRIKREKRNS